VGVLSLSRSTENKFDCLLNWERYNDYVLMDILDGHTFDATEYAKASAAFAMSDGKTMAKLADKRKREVDFIEAPDVIDKLDKPKITKGENKGKDRDWTVGERYAILRSTERTRAYARAKLDTLLEADIPFS
jgi:hypothetical protein